MCANYFSANYCKSTMLANRIWFWNAQIQPCAVQLLASSIKLKLNLCANQNRRHHHRHGKHVQSHYLLHPTHSNHTKYKSQKPTRRSQSHGPFHKQRSAGYCIIGLFDVKAIPKCYKYNVDIKSSIHDSLVHQPLFKRIIFALCNRVIGSLFQHLFANKFNNVFIRQAASLHVDRHYHFRDTNSRRVEPSKKFYLI